MKRLIILLVLSLWGLCCAASNANAVANKFYETNYKCIVYLEGGFPDKGEFEANPITEKTSYKEIMTVRVRLNLHYGQDGKKIYHKFYLEKMPDGRVEIVNPDQKDQRDRVIIGGNRRLVKEIFLNCGKIPFDELKALGR